MSVRVFLQIWSEVFLLCLPLERASSQVMTLAVGTGLLCWSQLPWQWLKDDFSSSIDNYKLTTLLQVPILTSFWASKWLWRWEHFTRSITLLSWRSRSRSLPSWRSWTTQSLYSSTGSSLSATSTACRLTSTLEARSADDWKPGGLQAAGGDHQVPPGGAGLPAHQEHRLQRSRSL